MNFRQNIFVSVVLCLVCGLGGCAGLPAMQQRVRRLAAQGEMRQASLAFDRSGQGYGSKNQLLAALDRGLVRHYAGDYVRSIDDFEEAKKIYDSLYTRSISEQALAWVWNDLTQPYRGEDFERAMMNVFQAMNFLMLGKKDEALVEARNVYYVLERFNQNYGGKKNDYHDDAFVQWLMGLIYESTGRGHDLNEAFRLYQRAVQVYEQQYRPHYGLDVPLALKENILSLADWMGPIERAQYQTRFPLIPFKTVYERAVKAELYCIVYRRQIAGKIPASLVLPGTDGYVVRVSFPRYRKTFGLEPGLTLTARADGIEKGALLERAEDLTAVARKTLENRQARIVATAVVRPALKQLVFEAVEDRVHDKAGKEAGELFRYAASSYIVYSEQADTRGWDTLPAEIWVGRLELEPGTYNLFIGNDPAGTVTVSAGERKFLSRWTRQ